MPESQSPKSWLKGHGAIVSQRINIAIALGQVYAIYIITTN